MKLRDRYDLWLIAYVILLPVALWVSCWLGWTAGRP